MSFGLNSTKQGCFEKYHRWSFVSTIQVCSRNPSTLQIVQLLSQRILDDADFNTTSLSKSTLIRLPALLVLKRDLFGGSEQSSEKANSGPVGMDPLPLNS
jgi:hypothetical protein